MRVRVCDTEYVVATWGRTLIQIWRGTPNGENTGRANRIALEFIAKAPSLATAMYVVEARSPLPDDAARRNIAAFSRDIVSRMSLAVVVAEGGGFRGALVRAVGVTLTTIAPHKSTFKFVNDVEEAAKLLARHLPPASGSATELIRATEEARAKIGTLLESP